MYTLSARTRYWLFALGLVTMMALTTLTSHVHTAFDAQLDPIAELEDSYGLGG